MRFGICRASKMSKADNSNQTQSWSLLFPCLRISSNLSESSILDVFLILNSRGLFATPLHNTSGFLDCHRKVDLAEAVTEQLKEAEENEWSDAMAAEQTYDAAAQIQRSTPLPCPCSRFVHNMKSFD